MLDAVEPRFSGLAAAVAGWAYINMSAAVIAPPSAGRRAVLAGAQLCPLSGCIHHPELHRLSLVVMVWYLRHTTLFSVSLSPYRPALYGSPDSEKVSPLTSSTLGKRSQTLSIRSSICACGRRAEAHTTRQALDRPYFLKAQYSMHEYFTYFSAAAAAAAAAWGEGVVRIVGQPTHRAHSTPFTCIPTANRYAGKGWIPLSESSPLCLFRRMAYRTAQKAKTKLNCIHTHTHTHNTSQNTPLSLLPLPPWIEGRNSLGRASTDPQSIHPSMIPVCRHRPITATSIHR